MGHPLGGELGESFVARDEVVENRFFIGGSQGECIHTGGELGCKGESGSMEGSTSEGGGGRDGAVVFDSCGG